MDNTEYHILNLTAQKGRLYYYQGNFFHPLELVGNSPGLVKRGIRLFLKDHKEMVAKDRADPAYKSLVDLMEDTDGNPR